MIRATGKRRAFTLLELLVVVAMIAIIVGAMTTSMTAAQERARIQKATAEVKVITQAILAYENWSKEELKNINDEDADAKTLSFLFGEGGSSRSGQPLPTLLSAAFRSGGKIVDPWGHPYKVKILKRGVTLNQNFSSLTSGFYLPNAYRLDDSERKVIWK